MPTPPGVFVSPSNLIVIVSFFVIKGATSLGSVPSGSSMIALSGIGPAISPKSPFSVPEIALMISDVPAAFVKFALGSTATEKGPVEFIINDEGEIMLIRSLDGDSKP